MQLLLNLAGLWTFGRYLEAAMVYPAPCIAITYLVGAWVGALASANLNSFYVTCGGSAGPCALLGGPAAGVGCAGVKRLLSGSSN